MVGSAGRLSQWSPSGVFSPWLRLSSGVRCSVNTHVMQKRVTVCRLACLASTFLQRSSLWSMSTGRTIACVWWAWFLFLTYTVPLGLYARFVLRLRFSELGLRVQGLLRHSWIYVVGFLIVLPLVVMVSDDPGFLKTYPFYRKAGESLPRLVIWELSYAAQFVGLEFFFRGAMLFCAVRLLGPWVIPAMLFPYMMLHFGKPMLECTGSIIAGVALGVVSLRTGAIYAGMLIHVSVAWTMDLLALWHKGVLQKLFFE